jgi:hypothetical protein
MNLKRLFMVLAVLLIWAACNEDDEGGVMAPSLDIESDEAVKPDSTLNIEVMVNAPGLLVMDGISGEVVNGEGVLTRNNFQGENQDMGSATFDFMAGSTENASTLVRFSALDQLGQTGTIDLEIDITSLQIKQVIVLNEGNFFSANGSLDVFDITQDQIDNGAYTANATVQHAVFHDDKVYVVTNAPDRLDILNSDLESEGTIDQGFDNPIDFAAVGNTGFVSNWGDINTAFSENPDSFIAIVDLESLEVTDSVMLTQRPQNLIAHNDMVYIALEGAAAVSVLNPGDLSLTDIPVAAGPSDLVLDDTGNIWALCTSGALVEINTDDMTAGTTIDGLTTSGFAEKMAIDGTGSLVYFLGGSNDSFTGLTTVYKVDLSTQEVNPFIEDGFALYGIGVNPESNEVYIGDSNAFQSTGTGFRYSATGDKLDEFATGIGPRGFVFK